MRHPVVVHPILKAVSRLQEPEESQLLALVAGEDVDALETLYQRWAPRFAGMLRVLGISAEDVPDVLQVVFLEIWQKAARYQAARGTPQAWMFQIVRHRAIDYIRRQRTGYASPTPADAPKGFDDTLTLHEALGHLGPKERAVIELTYFGGFTQREISRAWGVPIGTIKTWGHRGIQQLRHWILAAEGTNDDAPRG